MTSGTEKQTTLRSVGAVFAGLLVIVLASFAVDMVMHETVCSRNLGSRCRHCRGSGNNLPNRDQHLRLLSGGATRPVASDEARADARLDREWRSARWVRC